MYLDCDCAEVVDEGCKQDEDEAEEAGLAQVGCTGPGVIVVGVGQVKGEEEVVVVPAT